MTGESDLGRLIASMQPVLRDGVYVFAHVETLAEAVQLDPMMTFREDEALTVIARRETVEGAGLRYEFPSRSITLNVHSSLEAVGFLAAITARLAQLKMGVNPVSAFYHDHLFVPEHRAEDALAALIEMSGSQV
ncbi:ACT domain-containing protein [Shimia ponticola]|uniref:ACT domain-containing protein n=1 Tax=Shimia ponticola TaxID=2582893 RepID=UPI0011BF74F7|nr:ACT domain-containing protein [Shimia ponticola]